MIRFSVRRPVAVTMCSLAVVLFGLVSFGRLDLELLPDISYPSLTVETRYRGAAPVEVENLVTRKVEEALGVLGGVERISSASRPGLSQVILQFRWDTRMDLAALDVREKLDRVELPADAERPRLLRYDPSFDPVLRIGLVGDDLRTTRRIAEDLVKKELESSDGVAAVQVAGGLEEEIQVELDEALAAGYGIGIDHVVRRLAEDNVNLAGGALYHDETRYLVRTLNEFQDLEDIRRTVIHTDGGRVIRLGDVARVGRGYRDREVVIRVDGKEGVELGVYKEGDTNTVRVAETVLARLDGLVLPAGVESKVLFDQSRFISRAVDEVKGNAWLGGLLAVLVLLLFLKDLRSTLVIAVSIPVSIVATFFVMYRMGISLNVMSLGGLALGVGMLVDNAIVVLEAIVRHHQAGEPPLEAAERGASEVGTAVLGSTLTTVAVFLPIVFVEGIAAQLFRDQSWTVTIALLVSLLMSLTLAPMLAGRLAGGTRRAPLEPLAPPANGFREAGRILGLQLPALLLRGVLAAGAGIVWLIHTLTRPLAAAVNHVYGGLMALYPRVLRVALRARLLTLAATLGLFGLAILGLERAGMELIPQVQQGEFRFEVTLPEGTPLEVTTRAVQAVEETAIADPNVRRVALRAGAEETAGAGGRENLAELHVSLRDPRHEAETLTRLREHLGRIPGAAVELARPTLFSFKTPIEVEVYGEDLDVIASEAARLTALLARVPGLVDVSSSAEAGAPEVRVLFDRDRVSRMDLDPRDLAERLRDKVKGAVATRVIEGDRNVDIVVRASAPARSSVESLPQLAVARRGGVPVLLKSVAQAETGIGPAEVRRVGQRRAAIITANLEGRDLGGVVRDVDRVLHSTPLAPGVVATLSGQNREMGASFRSLYLAAGLAVFLVYLVMACIFESFLHPLIVMATVPMGLIGVVGALLVTGTSVSIIVLIGVVMLAGIVVNNAIVLVDCVNRLRAGGKATDEALVEAGSIRLRPILMTTLTTLLGLLPMALGLGEGAELRQPLAVTVVGGLLVSMLLTLVVIPSAYSLVERGRERARAR